MARSGEYDRPASYYMSLGVDGQPLPTVDDRMREISMNPSISPEERGTYLWRRRGGDFPHGDWVAPNWMAGATRGVGALLQPILGGTLESEDVTSGMLDMVMGGKRGGTLGAFGSAGPKKWKKKQDKYREPDDPSNILVEEKGIEDLKGIKKKGGKLIVGSGQDEGGIYYLKPHEKGITGKTRPSIEFGGVLADPKRRGKGIGQRALKDAIKRWKLGEFGTGRDFELSAFGNVPELGLDNAKYWRDQGVDELVEKWARDPALGPADVEVLRLPRMLGGEAPAVHTPYQPWQSKLFDVSGIDDPNRYPDVEQFELGRHRPTRTTKRMEALLADPNAPERYREFYAEGLPKGGGAWYNTRPLLDVSKDLFDEETGTEYWRDLMGMSSATSPKTEVKKEIARATYIRNFIKAGGDINKLGREIPFPTGYGALSWNTAQKPTVKDIIAGHGVNAPRRSLGELDKVRSYDQSKAGNLANITGDVHNEKILMSPYLGVKTKQGNPSVLQGKYAESEYALAEDWQRERAKELGVPPAIAQSGVWAGGEDITGVKDFRPWLQLFEERILDTAQQTGMPPKEVLKGVLSGDLYVADK